MTARQKFDFEKKGKITTKYTPLSFPVKQKEPDHIKDIRIGRGIPSGWHYLGDRFITDPLNKSFGSWQETEDSRKVIDLVRAIEKGDLAAIKKMEPKELKKYLNKALIHADSYFLAKKEAGKVPGYTPLMLAALEGKTDIMRYLIEQGADLSLKNNYNGKTAADYLRHYKEMQEKKQAKDKEKDELNALMDEVDGKKPYKPQKPQHRLSREELSNALEKEVARLRKVGAKMPDGRLVGKKRKKGQFGNGKGIDDLIGKMQDDDRTKGRATSRAR